MPETIITSEPPSTSSPLNPSTRIVCRVCQKQFSQYTCPRCNMRYCSLQCYKSHSMRCTESFMKDNVMSELQQLQPADETKQKMMDILRRFHSQDEEPDVNMDEDDDSTLSEETVQKILSGDEISYNDLSAEEKVHFHKSITSGQLSKLIEPWDPWWLKPAAAKISLAQNGTQLIQPLKKENDQTHEAPSGPDAPLMPTSQLSQTKPSPLLPVHLIDITYSYCFTLRVYNGDWQSDAIGSATVALTVSSVLSQSQSQSQSQPSTVAEALGYCLEKICSPGFKHLGGLGFGVGLIDDVASLVELGGNVLVCMLCDFQSMILLAIKEFKSEKKKGIIKKLRFCERKIYFMMCWAFEQPADVWGGLAAVVRAEKTAILSYGGGERGKVEDGVKMKGKCLIEEVE